MILNYGIPVWLLQPLTKLLKYLDIKYSDIDLIEFKLLLYSFQMHFIHSLTLFDELISQSVGLIMIFRVRTDPSLKRSSIKHPLNRRYSGEFTVMASVSLSLGRASTLKHIGRARPWLSIYCWKFDEPGDTVRDFGLRIRVSQWAYFGLDDC